MDEVNTFFWFTLPEFGDMKAIGRQDKNGDWWLHVIPEWFTAAFKETESYRMTDGRMMFAFRSFDEDIGSRVVKGDPAPACEYKRNDATSSTSPPMWQPEIIVGRVIRHSLEIAGEVVWTYTEVQNGGD